MIEDLMGRVAADPRAAALAGFVARWWWLFALAVAALVLLPGRSR